MNVLLLSPYPEQMKHAFTTMDNVVAMPSLPSMVHKDADWIVSFGCREIIRGEWLQFYKGKIVNIHISYLPYNRGADPNFWSWLDGTPKGISVHQIDDGIDTGPIYAQTIYEFHNPAAETLRTSYAGLQRTAIFLFSAIWPSIRVGKLEPRPQAMGGSYHRSRDKEPWFKRLPKGYDTPVLEIAELGRWARCGQLVY